MLNLSEVIEYPEYTTEDQAIKDQILGLDLQGQQSRWLLDAAMNTIFGGGDSGGDGSDNSSEESSTSDDPATPDYETTKAQLRSALHSTRVQLDEYAEYAQTRNLSRQERDFVKDLRNNEEALTQAIGVINAEEFKNSKKR